MNATIFMRHGETQIRVLDVTGGPAVQIDQPGSYLTIYFEDDPDRGMQLETFIEQLQEKLNVMREETTL